MTYLQTVMGALISDKNEAIVGGKKPITDTEASSTAAYVSAVIYAIFAAFCGWQTIMHGRANMAANDALFGGAPAYSTSSSSATTPGNNW